MCHFDDNLWYDIYQDNIIYTFAKFLTNFQVILAFYYIKKL